MQKVIFENALTFLFGLLYFRIKQKGNATIRLQSHKIKKLMKEYI